MQIKSPATDIPDQTWTTGSVSVKLQYTHALFNFGQIKFKEFSSKKFKQKDQNSLSDVVATSFHI